jgi:hypothetical protein
MGESVNKLQLIDVEQLNRLMNLLEKRESSHQIVRNSRVPVEQIELIDSYKNMQDSVKIKALKQKTIL